MATCGECNDFLCAAVPCYRDNIPTRIDQESPSSCPGCTTLWKGISSFIPDLEGLDRSEPIEVKIRFQRLFDDDLLRLDIIYNKIDGFMDVMELEFYTLPGQPSPWPGLNAANHIPADPSSSERWATLQSWIEQCCSDHELCPSSETSPLPSRVIDVRPAGMENGTKDVLLYETLGEPACYACLSYCWGDALSIRTTTSNLELFKQGISWTSLPRTFQDAVELVRALGLRFIWIDALCIIQDDERDWARESSKMAQIYSTSYITIGAAHAKDSNGGCFFFREEYQRYHEIRGNHANGIPNSIYVRKRIHMRGSTIEEDKDSPVMLSRGWTFQERSLSPRIVLFGAQEMFYECKTASLCECKIGQTATTTEPNFRTDFSKARSGDRQQVVGFWHQLVKRYSSLNLTFISDRLPAISGLAHQFRERNGRPGTQYLAGIWSHSLIEDLQWIVISSDPPKLGQYVAPSWSWISAGSACRYEERDSIITSSLQPEILEMSCTPRTSDPCGEVEAGHLVLRGVVFEALVECNFITPVSVGPDHRNQGRISAKPGHPWFTSPDTDIAYLRFLPDPHLILTWNQGQAVGRRMLCLILDMPTVKNWNGMIQKEVFVLVLQQSPREEGAYERIGFGREYRYGGIMVEDVEMRTVRII